MLKRHRHIVGYFVGILFGAMTAVCAAQTKDVRLRTSDSLSQKVALERFIAGAKFKPEGSYSGATPEAKRQSYEMQVNGLAKRLLDKLPSGLSKADVLNAFKPTLGAFDLADSEDKDRMLDYLTMIMDIFGIKSSDGLLNKWRYGFDPSKSQDERNAEAVAQMTPDELVLLSKLDQVRGKSALATLTTLLGTPSVNTGGIAIWFIRPDQSSGISLKSEKDTQTLIWASTGRLTYARKLEP